MGRVLKGTRSMNERALTAGRTMRVRQTSPSRMVLTARGTSSLRIGSAVGQASAPPWMSAPQLGLAMGGLLTLRGALRLRRALTVASRVTLHLDCFVTLHLDCFLRVRRIPAVLLSTWRRYHFDGL